jgi:hypothetical protein
LASLVDPLFLFTGYFRAIKQVLSLYIFPIIKKHNFLALKKVYCCQVQIISAVNLHPSCDARSKLIGNKYNISQKSKVSPDPDSISRLTRSKRNRKVRRIFIYNIFNSSD